MFLQIIGLPLIASFDTIMNPPYDITSVILGLLSSVSEKIGAVNSLLLDKPEPQLRKRNRIRTIQSSLQIEGNTLSETQVTALIDNKRVLGPEKDIREVINAIRVYDLLDGSDPFSETKFLQAHKGLMDGLIPNAGKYRQKAVGIVKGSKVTHLAPPAHLVPKLMKELFQYIRKSKDLILIKSCVFHYEVEFIHPFADGNGRMGRLWQTSLLMTQYPLFEFLPFETLISRNQKAYYQALAASDRLGNSTPFIEFMLGVLDQSLTELLDFNGKVLTDAERLRYFVESGPEEFTRKDYMQVFKNISTATASRDLSKGLELKLFRKKGQHNQVRYHMHKKP